MYTQLYEKNKYENGDGSTEIFCDLGEVVSSKTIKLWIQMFIEVDSIDLSYPSGR